MHSVVCMCFSFVSVTEKRSEVKCAVDSGVYSDGGLQ